MEYFDGLIFAVNGVMYKLPAREVDASMKLAAFLRDTLGLRGTKISCGEGGCGACSVLLSRYDVVMKKVVTISANACLRPLVTLHGYNVTTVEGIGGPNHPNGVHAIQQKFHDMSASQCGYCTPGFVVALYSQLARKPESSMLDIEAGLDGNLCRCTGFEPILGAAKSFAVDSVESSQNSIGGGVQAELDAQFPAELRGSVPRCGAEFGAHIALDSPGSKRYLRADTLAQAESFFENNRNAKFSCSQTSLGMYKNHLSSAECLIDVSGIAELRAVEANATSLTVGGATPLASFAGLLLQQAEVRGSSTRQAFIAIARIVERIANHHVRNVASIAGNLTMCKELGFASDLATPLCAIGAKVNIVRFVPEGGKCVRECVNLLDHLAAPSPAGSTSLIVSVALPFLRDKTVLHCYRTAIRCVNAHAITNGAFRAHVGEDGRLSDVEAIYGAVGEFDKPGQNAPRRNEDAVAMLRGQTFGKQLARDVEMHFQTGDFVIGAYKRSHRQRLVKAFLLHFLNDVRATLQGEDPNKQRREVHSGTQKFTVVNTPEEVLAGRGTAPIGEAIPRPDGVHHACGTAVYVSDIKEPKDALFASYVISRVALGKIRHIPVDFATTLHNVVRVVTAKDLPSWCPNRIINVGQYFGNQPHIAPHYEIISSGDVYHCGQVVAVVLAKTIADAQFAAKQLSERVEYDLPADGAKPLVTIRDAMQAKRELMAQRVIIEGDPEAALRCETVQHCITQISIGSQKHFYMETHAAYAVPHDHRIEVHCPTQAPSYMHEAVATALGVPMSEVAFQHFRTGGSFGAKVPADHAVVAAVLAKLTGRAVKVHLDRNTDMQLQGGREETEVSAMVGVDKAAGKVVSVRLRALKNLGVRQDISGFAVGISLPRCVLDCYDIPNRHIDSAGVCTNLPSRVPVRGPGEVEASVVGETVMDLAAFELGVHGSVVREANLKKDMAGDVFTVPKMWAQLMDEEGWRARVEESVAFNKANTATKKGVGLTPFAYTVGTRYAFAQVTVFADGSVVVHHGGCENGQGLYIKVLQGACYELSKVTGTAIPLALFRSGGNQTHTVPNQGVTGGSTASESSAMAAIDGARQLAERLKAVRDAMPEDAADAKKDWHAICRAAYAKRVNMSAQGFFDGQAQTPPLNYKCFAVGAAAVTLDVMTGQVTVDRFDVKYDAARSLNPAVDLGQATGAAIMGLGYMLLEDAHTNPTTGWLEHDGTWDYKIPSVFDVPTEFNVELINNPNFDRGVLSSKASGEPPICTAPALLGAIRQCVISARGDSLLGGFPEISVPMTPDKIAVACGSLATHDD